MDYAKIFKQQIEDLGIKYKKVEELTGIPENVVSQYANGHRPIPEAKIRLFCLSFGINPKIFGLNVRNSEHLKALKQKKGA